MWDKELYFSLCLIFLLLIHIVFRIPIKEGDESTHGSFGKIRKYMVYISEIHQYWSLSIEKYKNHRK